MPSEQNQQRRTHPGLRPRAINPRPGPAGPPTKATAIHPPRTHLKPANPRIFPIPNKLFAFTSDWIASSVCQLICCCSFLSPPFAHAMPYHTPSFPTSNTSNNTPFFGDYCVPFRSSRGRKLYIPTNSNLPSTCTPAMHTHATQKKVQTISQPPTYHSVRHLAVPQKVYFCLCYFVSVRSHLISVSG